MPPEIANLSFAGRKVIRLARVCCSVIRVTLDPKQYHTMKSLGAEMPQFVTGNVMAKPLNASEAPLILGSLPKDLATCMVV